MRIVSFYGLLFGFAALMTWGLSLVATPPVGQTYELRISYVEQPMPFDNIRGCERMRGFVVTNRDAVRDGRTRIVECLRKE